MEPEDAMGGGGLGANDSVVNVLWPRADDQMPTPEAALLVLYSIVFAVGVSGNLLIIVAACQNSRHLPVRNNLLINLCVSDLLVTSLSGPVSALIALNTNYHESLVASAASITASLQWVCRSVFYIQSMPVAASTFSLMMLSLDRLVFFFVREILIAYLCASILEQIPQNVFPCLSFF
jgi:hypothetical protein